MSKEFKNNMGIDNSNITVGNDLNQKFSKSNQNQIDKSNSKTTNVKKIYKFYLNKICYRKHVLW